MRQSEKEWSVFTRRFAESHKAVEKVAEFLARERKLHVTIPSTELAPNISKSPDYIDKGDIICHTANGKEYIIEVKGTKTEFTSAKDYPYKTVIINEVVKAHRIPAFAYFVVNKDRTHAFVVKTDTMEHWTIRHIKDSERGDSEDVYFCEMGWGEFIEL